MRFPKGFFQMNYDKCGDDTATLTINVRMNKSERKSVLKDQETFIEACREAVILPEPGCHCSYCQRGYDCCGRMFPNYVKVEPVKRGIRLVQHYSRNV